MRYRPLSAAQFTGQNFVIDAGMTRKMIYDEWVYSVIAYLARYPRPSPSPMPAPCPSARRQFTPRNTDYHTYTRHLRIPLAGGEFLRRVLLPMLIRVDARAPLRRSRQSLPAELPGAVRVALAARETQATAAGHTAPVWRKALPRCACTRVAAEGRWR